MDPFVWALIGFVLLHVGVAATGLRTAIVGRIGEGPYRALFSLASLGLLAALIASYAALQEDLFNPLNHPLWAPPPELRWGAYVLIFLGVTLAVAGIFTPGPTLAGFEKRGLARAEPARGALRITRHPFLWGVALWGAGHLLANGERADVMLFGALGLMALFGARSIDRKGRARDPEGWARFEAVSSNLPFAAITQGRNTLKLRELWLPVVAGAAGFALIAWAHEALIGVSAITAP